MVDAAGACRRGYVSLLDSPILGTGVRGLRLEAGWVKKVTGRPTISVGSVVLEADVLGSANDGSPYARLDALNDQI